MYIYRVMLTTRILVLVYRAASQIFYNTRVGKLMETALDNLNHGSYY